MHGLYYLLPTGQPFAIPLQTVDVQCTIVDTTARVLLSQEYLNNAQPNGNSMEARYSFPIPVRAAVCAFTMVKQDGSRVMGVVEEKKEAKERYEKAKEEGKLASLMEMSTPDVFTVSVGNILPDEKVTIQVTYAVELTEDEENDSLRFHLPMHIGARYGNAPANISATNSTAFFKLAVSIEMARPISKIGCPSHTIQTELGPNASLSNIPAELHANFAAVSFTSTETLSKDFILTLKSANADAPRCIAERHMNDKTFALALTLVPKFTLPDIPSQEFIFLVDRSGSMDGERINTAKKALVVLLRSLPTEGSFFNIQSFGSGSKLLWRGSKVYDQSSLDEATKLVDSMQADFGGTEIAKALSSAFASRNTSVPTSLFVLTDGDTWDLSNALSIVETAVKSAQPKAPVRVFTLGIGNSASTAMVDGIARMGNGISMFVSDGESFTGKTARLLKAARTPVLCDIHMDWGVPATNDSESFEFVEADESDTKTLLGDSEEHSKAPTSLFDNNTDPLKHSSNTGAASKKAIVLPPFPSIQQAPAVLQTIYPGNRLRLYVILSSPSESPKQVVLRASLASGERFELAVPVVVAAQLTRSDEATFPVHTLAAKKLIQDFEDGSQVDSDIIKASIIRLGKTYSLASKYTSFIAVDESEIASQRSRVLVASPSPVGLQMRGGLRRRSLAQPMASMAPIGGSLGSGTIRARATYGASSMVSHSIESEEDMVETMMYTAAPPSRSMKKKSKFGGGFFGLSFNKSQAIPPPPVAAMPTLMISPVRRKESENSISKSTNSTFSLDALARLQSFNGSFTPGPTFTFCSLPSSKTTTTDVLDALPVEIRTEAIAMTLFAMASMVHRLRDEKDAWEGMYGKASSWVQKEMSAKGYDLRGVEELVEMVWAVAGSSAK